MEAGLWGMEVDDFGEFEMLIEFMSWDYIFEFIVRLNPFDESKLLSDEIVYAGLFSISWFYIFKFDVFRFNLYNLSSIELII